MDEETKASSRLPTLIEALNTPYDPQIADSSAEQNSTEKASEQYEDGRTDSLSSGPTGRGAMIKRLWRTWLKPEDTRRAALETKGRRTDDMLRILATTENTLETEVGGADRMPRALANYHAELQSLLDKLKDKDGRSSRKKALAWTFKQYCEVTPVCST
ncbi:hypothetical protein JB92DRAFT_3146183 [Gautieria morchelliformis]|nr:hypothetical protein JB92DRAFT_3146183 [Gautieria morchelliformis]